MLAENKLTILKGFLETLSEEELIWTNGYVSGIATGNIRAAAPCEQKVTIVYGTESGNSKKLANDFSAKAKKAGINVKLASLDQYRITDLQKEENLLVVISTQGDGEPPASAKKFCDYLQDNSISLPALNFGVLALGDTAYPLFCKAGEDVDIRLAELGAKRAIAIQKCDLDFEEQSHEWFKNALTRIAEIFPQKDLPLAAVKKSVNKRDQCGKIISNTNLSGRGSAKQTHHIEIATNHVAYQPGDSIGIVPGNPEALVETILKLTNCDKDRKITFRGEEYAVSTLLMKKVNIRYLPERVVQKYAHLVAQEIPPMRIDLLNLLKIYPISDALQFEDIVGILEPVTPRLYSISSSPLAHPEEIHVTVARDVFDVNGEIQYGLCSDHLLHLPEGCALDFDVHQNSRFKLPDPEKDIIMVGPGTGIAPFRSFIADRDARGATGRNWLFFGDQKFSCDFLYQTEIQQHLASGLLTKVSLAFSRDQSEKIYVQHRMLEHAEELYEWIESGAFVYICGAKDPMGEDVERTLVDIISLCGRMSAGEALDYLAALRENGRFLKDTY